MSDGIKKLNEILLSGVKRAKIADSDVTYQDSDQLLKAKQEMEAAQGGRRNRVRFMRSYTERDL